MNSSSFDLRQFRVRFGCVVLAASEVAWSVSPQAELRSGLLEVWGARFFLTDRTFWISCSFIVELVVFRLGRHWLIT